MYSFSISIRALAKNSSFGFSALVLRVGKKQMCCLCGWLFWYATLRSRITVSYGFICVNFRFGTDARNSEWIRT
tara:strand:+ start:6468 stop:6689 length:222 start_codon:yes stop_codon:yes gene_type:complete